MNTPTAFRATYSDLKLIKTRQCVQIVFELPLADFDAAYEVLGGLPDSSKETWFGIAPLGQPKPAQLEAPKRKPWESLPPQQQAAMRSGEAAFQVFLKESYPDEWHETNDANECLKLICGVTSKRDIGMNQKARIIWTQLDSHYQAWGRA